MPFYSRYYHPGPNSSRVEVYMPMVSYRVLLSAFVLFFIFLWHCHYLWGSPIFVQQIYSSVATVYIIIYIYLGRFHCICPMLSNFLCVVNCWFMTKNRCNVILLSQWCYCPSDFAALGVRLNKCHYTVKTLVLICWYLLIWGTNAENWEAIFELCTPHSVAFTGKFL